MVFLMYIPRSEIAGSYGSSTFSFLRNLHSVTHSGYTNWHTTKNVGVFHFLHTLSSIYCLQIFLMVAILTGVK